MDGDRTDSPRAHLGYCSNIHPGETWDAHFAALRTALPEVKAAVSPQTPFGVGLRLSAQAAHALRDPATLDAFRAFLDAHDLYVFTLNGFPYGRFHGAPVKQAVYAPDWRDPARLAYTEDLARVLAALLPVHGDDYGSISTVPGGFRPDIAHPAARHAVAAGLRAAADRLAQIEADTGRRLILALEPEPACLLETTAEALAFLEEIATTPAARRHLGLCLDACHAAVEFEDADATVAALRASPVPVAKIQLSSALRIADVDADAAAALAAFADPVYLHQTVVRDARGLHRYLDLPDALAHAPREGAEWRTHFHVPIHAARLRAFATTQDFLAQLLAAQRDAPLSAHLEVETYTWEVLPPAERGERMIDDIVHELRWAQARL